MCVCGVCASVGVGVHVCVSAHSCAQAGMHTLREPQARTPTQASASDPVDTGALQLRAGSKAGPCGDGAGGHQRGLGSDAMRTARCPQGAEPPAASAVKGTGRGHAALALLSTWAAVR